LHIDFYHKDKVMLLWNLSTEILCILMQAVVAGLVEAAERLRYTGQPADL